MTAMTPSIRQVPKLIFHDVDSGDPPAPLTILQEMNLELKLCLI